ncbi:PEP-CTERM sorting domain-containing protein [Thermosulfuriphilus ammonigenes]|uniref:PEP-CTERM sorting domain-containing protein n=1 Tax=Thermosulfuriphilus ammonigenes TaxID=1936021 RepID=A0A6G7PUK5_9BACT|nr:PEP-CTERM sorting domain-containing protein [Thermosulfuriphilus ammonigenes]MBA2848492.1 hypothetical protein [Thermosulfuriphilus ammonigenes]QIJ71359.1 PEP-CTERM sorting domain-containing protein [Thermosulfuriphilus ammonigenes]
MRYLKGTVMISFLILLVFFIPQGAKALTIGTKAYYYLDDYPPSLPILEEDSDYKTAGGGAIQSQVQSSWGGIASSYADESGIFAVHSEFGAGSLKAYYFTAKATSSTIITNPTSHAIEYGLFFQIPEVTLGIWDDCTCQGLIQHSKYEIDILLNGVSIWKSDATLEGGNANGYTLTQSGDVVLNPSFSFWYDAYFQSAPYNGYLALGRFGPGDSFTLGYEMMVMIYGADFETGAIASVGDPFNLTSTVNFNVSGSGITPIPEPSTLLLLSSGLAGLAGLRKKLKPKIS